MKLKVITCNMLLHADIIVATPSHKDGATIHITDKETIEITVDVGCASPGVTFNWSRPENTENSSMSCSGNPYFRTSKTILRIGNATKDDEGTFTVTITHPTLKSRSYTWTMKSGIYTSHAGKPVSRQIVRLQQIVCHCMILELSTQLN